MTRPKLILGSGSPRRLELLAQLGLAPDDVRPPDVDEDPQPRELPRAYCRRVTEAKIAAIPIEEDEIALAADTTVAVGRRILGKPADADEARQFLRMMSGRRHRVITCVAVKNSRQTWLREVVTAVRMKQLSAEEIEDYIATGDWQGKAGGYAIQGPAGAFIPWVQGSHSAVVGLPVHETAQLLRAAGMPVGRARP